MRLSADSRRDEGRVQRRPKELPPATFFRFNQIFEEPHVHEGFERVRRVPFFRRLGPEYQEKALILDYDGTLRCSTKAASYPREPSELKLLSGREEKLREYKDRGYLLWEFPISLSSPAETSQRMLRGPVSLEPTRSWGSSLTFAARRRWPALGVAPMPGLGVALVRD